MLTRSRSFGLLLLFLFWTGALSAQTPGAFAPPSAVAAFQTWAERHLSASPTLARQSSPGEGIILAKQRRQAMEALIQTDPAQAVAAALPAALRTRLSPELVDQLETPVSGTGDLVVRGALATPAGPGVEAVRRFVRLNGTEYRAYVYGARAGETSKHGIPLHGVVVNGKLALAESPLREIESGEVPDSAQPVIEVPDPAEKDSTEATPVLAQMGGKVYRFTSPEQLQKTSARILTSEQTLGVEPTQSASATVENPLSRQALAAISSAWSTGNKKVLIIRIDFSDKPGDPRALTGGIVYTASYVRNFADTQISPYYQQSSYGNTSLTNTVTTQLYRMPHPAAYYATLTSSSGVFLGDDRLHADAEAAAGANYNVASYDRTIVLFSSLSSISRSQINYAGLADVGGTKIWSNGEFDFRVIAHEMGHTYGLYHANLWQVRDGNPISLNGVDQEYADDFDTMGVNNANNTATDFNPWFKTLLGWLPDSQVQTINANGTYRIRRFDQTNATGVVALKIVKDGSHNYWVSIRRKFTGNSSMSHGAYVIWGYNYNRQSDLLDLTTPGKSDQDAALAVGSTFVDAADNIVLRPVGKGGAAPNEYLDLQVNLGNTITTNVSPSNSGSTSGGGNYAYGSSVTVTATPRPGFFFVNWSENGTSVSSSASYKFIVTQSRSLTANFNQKPNQPTNIAPADQATNQSVTLTLRASAFSDSGGSNTQSKSEWVIRRAANNALVFDSGEDVTDRTSFTLPISLSNATIYTWQVRYADNYGTWSDYSAATTFTTRAATIPSFLPYRGTYYGSFLPNSISETFRGTISITLGSNGAFSASISAAAARYSLRGLFSGDGTFTGSIPRKGTTPIAVTLRLDASNRSNKITGTIDGETLSAGKYLFTKTQPALQAGTYVVFLGHPGDRNLPQGDGYAWVSIARSGAVHFVGVLGDGTPVSQSIALGNAGDWVVYLPLYSNQGFISGVVTFSANGTSYRPNGSLQWFKPAGLRGQSYYPGGFGMTVSLTGNPYAALVFTPNTFPYAAGRLTLGSVTFNLQPAVQPPLIFRRSLVYLGSNNLVLSLTTASGAISGSFTDPNGQVRRFAGLYSSPQVGARGLFGGDGWTGFMEFNVP